MSADGRTKGQPEDPSDEKNREAQQPTYVAHIALANDRITTENGMVRMEPGMAVTAEIKTGRRSVISYLLSPMARFKQEAMRER